MINENKLINVGVLKEYHNSKVVPALADKADKSTTLSGYGITDAKIADGVITLGGNTITPLTEHQDITGKADLVGGVVKADQLQLKTINGVSVKGTGDIAIDLSLYKMVDALPQILVDGNLNPAINMDKIYLVPASITGTNNIYAEYVLVNVGTTQSPSYVWEKLGEYSSSVDLESYFKTADITEGNGLGMTEGKLTMSVATDEAAGAMSAADKTKLDSISAATWEEFVAALEEITE